MGLQVQGIRIDIQPACPFDGAMRGADAGENRRILQALVDRELKQRTDIEHRFTAVLEGQTKAMIRQGLDGKRARIHRSGPTRST